jgi:hypothetical protein
MPSSTRRTGLWDPSIESLGLTEDTDLGPVDLVAIARHRAGRRVTLTTAERAYLAANRPTSLLSGVLGLARDLTPTARKVA